MNDEIKSELLTEAEAHVLTPAPLPIISPSLIIPLYPKKFRIITPVHFAIAATWRSIRLVMKSNGGRCKG